MDPARRALRLNTVELRRRPGVVREVTTTATSDELDVDDVRLVEPVEVDLVATSSVDGIVVRGSVEAAWSDECRRCLTAIPRRETAEIDELYQEEVVDPDAFELGPDVLDLYPLVRDTVELVLDDPPPLCRPDCAGICPTCGTDRNTSACECATSVRDERWAALDQLLDDDGG